MGILLPRRFTPPPKPAALASAALIARMGALGSASIPYDTNILMYRDGYCCMHQ